MSATPFDAERARLLVREISANLAALPASGAKYAELRAEVDALKALLEAPEAHPPVVRESLGNLRRIVTRAEAELRADGIRAGILASEIGRMLGLD